MDWLKLCTKDTGKLLPHGLKCKNWGLFVIPRQQKMETVPPCHHLLEFPISRACLLSSGVQGPLGDEFPAQHLELSLMIIKKQSARRSKMTGGGATRWPRSPLTCWQCDMH